LENVHNVLPTNRVKRIPNVELEEQSRRLAFLEALSKFFNIEIFVELERPCVAPSSRKEVSDTHDYCFSLEEMISGYFVLLHIMCWLTTSGSPI
jgi:elongation factor P--beta-lysine ligase